MASEQQEEKEIFQELSDVRPDAAPANTQNAAPVSSVPNIDKMLQTQPDGSSSSQTNPDGTPVEGGNLVQKFRQMWITEKASPELLFYESDVVAEVKSAIEERQMRLNELRQNTRDVTFLCTLLQMEIERIKYVMHSYHRVRLKKLEKYATYIITEKQTDRCSPAELKFVMGYADLVASHYSSSFLTHLPDKISNWFSRDIPSDTMLIVKPDLQNSFVTFRCKHTIENYPLPDDEVVTLNMNDIVVGNWKDFKALFTDGEIELM